MTVNVSEALKTPGAVFHASFTEDFPDMEYLGSTYRYHSPVALDTDYVYTGSHIAFKGSFRTTLLTQCSRCLKVTAYPVSHDFEEQYSKTDPESYGFTGETAELDRMVEDIIVLNLPGRFLCKEDCKGLCMDCGTDLNEGACGCAGEAGRKDNPFAALQKLFNEDKEV